MESTEYGTVSARRVYAAELARQRRISGWTFAQLSNVCNYEASYLHRLETGGRLGSLEAAEALDEAYETGDLLASLWRLAKEEVKRSRYGNFAEIEADATSIQEFSISTIPGLLQTSAYAEALLRTTEPVTDEELAEGVTTRTNRQVILTGKRAIAYRALLDESVLRRPILEPAAWGEQLEKLIAAAEQPNVKLHVVPFSTGLHRLLNSALQLLWLKSGRTVAFVESCWSGQLIEEIEDVDQLRLFYDRLRDSAMSPSESLALLRTTLEEHTSCSTTLST